MTAPHGGYRRPANPAPVSGPGKYSRRTDGGPADTRQPIRPVTGMGYGEGQLTAIQGAAPMAATQGAPEAPVAQPADLANVVPFGAPTARPGEPVTAGADAGPGPGTEALGLPKGDADPGWQYLVRSLPALELMANSPTASDSFRQFVRRVRSLA